MSLVRARKANGDPIDVEATDDGELKVSASVTIDEVTVEGGVSNAELVAALANINTKIDDLAAAINTVATAPLSVRLSDGTAFYVAGGGSGSGASEAEVLAAIEAATNIDAIATNTSTISGNVDGLEASATTIIGHVDTIESLLAGAALTAAVKSALETATTTDGLETSLTTIIGHVDGIEALVASATITAAVKEAIETATTVNDVETLITATNTALADKKVTGTVTSSTTTSSTSGTPSTITQLEPITLTRKAWHIRSLPTNTGNLTVYEGASGSEKIIDVLKPGQSTGQCVGYIFTNRLSVSSNVATQGYVFWSA